MIPDLGQISLAYDETGPQDGPGLVLLHALGSDRSVWADLIAALPPGLRIIAPDLRGHGESPAPDEPYYMGDLVADVARLMDKLGMREAAVLGLSMGGMVAQGLAAERLDLVRVLLLTGTAVKIGTPAIWDARIADIRFSGISPLMEANMTRWFAATTRKERPDLVDAARARFRATDLEGYIGCAQAIGETDLYESTARLRLPTLVMAGSEDGSTPPDLVREVAELIPGAQFELIRNAAHMAPVEQPQEMAAHIADFLHATGHLT
ncbi:MAG: 3-oxoadipate enol-lactonase [Rhodobacterales bacterium]|nr:MAG: 3-oxoadipate enol-lactonase [Rhodobacterales bacterium]